jgi:hypothetical protein
MQRKKSVQINLEKCQATKVYIYMYTVKGFAISYNVVHIFFSWVNESMMNCTLLVDKFNFPEKESDADKRKRYSLKRP